MKEIQVTENNIWIPWEYAEIQEIKGLDKNNENGLRAYVEMIGIDGNHSITIQIRTFDGIGDFGKGKKRNMMANINLTVQELETILSIIKSYDDPNSKMSHK